MIAVDANVLIYIFEGNEEFGEDALSLLNTAEQTSLDCVTSELIYGEMCSFPMLTNAGVDRAIKFIDQAGLEIIEISKEVLINAAEIRRQQGVKLPDAIYLATAILSGSKIFVTNDKNLLKKPVKGIRIVPLAKWRNSLPEMIK